VAFTNDWAEDAARRDFTMNAIYADRMGHLYDPTGGIADLKAGRVRFVGDADARIREDYLRILRLFRFHAWYGRGEVDAVAVEAAEKNRAGLKKLSGERTQKELLRLLEAENPLPSLRVMHARHLLEQILPEPLRLERLASLIDIARTHGLDRPPVLALAALLSTKEQARAVAAGLRFSNADRERLTGALSSDGELKPGMTRRELRRALYRFGLERTLDLLLLAWAETPSLPGWEGLLHGVREWARPEFPVDGRDALDAGLREGPGVGRILAALERWWVDQDFAPGREALLAKLKELAPR
jgi:poly(A) polymerase